MKCRNFSLKFLLILKLCCIRGLCKCSPPDPWLTHNIIVSLIRDQILHSPDNALAQVTLQASDWLTRGHVTRMLASDWSPGQSVTCHKWLTWNVSHWVGGPHITWHSLCRHVRPTSIIQDRRSMSTSSGAWHASNKVIKIAQNYFLYFRGFHEFLIPYLRIPWTNQPCTCLLVENCQIWAIG